MPTNKFPEQAELIERVKTILNITDEALAVEVGVRPETLQKYAAGYQKAGGKLMQIIKRLPEMRRAGVAAGPEAGGHASGTPTPPEPPSAQTQLKTVLNEGTLDEVRLIRQVISTVFRQITERRRPAALTDRARRVALFEGRPRLLPALGYIPAGVPQEAIGEQADQFIVVPTDEYPEAEFALKVQGDSMVDADLHHGDWVLMTNQREPRDGSVVAALIDHGTTTLKTYGHDEAGQPFLRSENRAYPAQIIPRDEMKVQGVMVGKLRLPPATGAGGKDDAPF